MVSMAGANGDWIGQTRGFRGALGFTHQVQQFIGGELATHVSAF